MLKHTPMAQLSRAQIGGTVLLLTLTLVSMGWWTLGHTESPPSAKVTLTTEQRAYLQQLGPITVAPDPDWLPYEHVDDQGNFTGIAADLLALVADRLGIEFTYVFPRDWDHALALSQANDVLILPFLNQTPAREQWLVFTSPLFVDPSVFITREDHPFIFDATQLTDETIIFPSGTSLEERVRQDFPNLTILTVPTENEVFQAVSQGAADMTLRSLTVAAYTIRKEGLFNLKIAGQAPEPYTNYLRMGVLRSEPLLRDILNQGIATITPGEREEIVNRHVNITIVTPVDYTFMLQIMVFLAVLIALSMYWNNRLRATNAVLKDIERSQSLLLSNLPGIAYRCHYDALWTMTFISEGCFKLTGYHSEDLLQNHVVSFAQLIAPEDRDRVNEIWANADPNRNEPVCLEYRIITATGVEKWVFEQGVFVSDPHHQQLMIEGLIIDITGRKNAEAQVLHSPLHSLQEPWN